MASIASLAKTTLESFGLIPSTKPALLSLQFQDEDEPEGVENDEPNGSEHSSFDIISNSEHSSFDIISNSGLPPLSPPFILREHDPPQLLLKVTQLTNYTSWKTSLLEDGTTTEEEEEMSEAGSEGSCDDITLSDYSEGEIEPQPSSPLGLPSPFAPLTFDQLTIANTRPRWQSLPTLHLNVCDEPLSLRRCRSAFDLPVVSWSEKRGLVNAFFELIQHVSLALNVFY